MKAQRTKLPKNTLYRKIVEDLKRQIDEGRLLPGNRLPSIQALVNEHKVSHITIRSSLAELSSMGYIYSHPRAGFFVSAETSRQSATLRRAKNDRSAGIAGDFTSEIAAAKIGMIAVKASPDPFDSERSAHFALMQTLVARGAEQAIGEGGGAASFSSIDNWTQIPTEFHKVVASQIDRGARALIVLDVYDHPGLSEAVMEFVHTSEVPLIYVSSGETCRPPFHIFGDNTAAGLMAGRHLLRQGFTDIVYVSPLEASWVDERAAGVARAIAEVPRQAQFRELPSADERLSYNQYLREHIYLNEQSYLRVKLIEKALADVQGSPGIIAATDDTAMIVHQMLVARGLTPGKDFGLIGHDDEPATRLLGITTVFPRFEQLGRQAAMLASQAIKGQISTARLRIPPVLYTRESTYR